MTTLGSLDTPTLLGVLGLLGVLACMPFFVNRIHYRMLVARASAGTSISADVEALVQNKKYRHTLTETQRLRLLFAQGGGLTVDEAREWAEDPSAFPVPDSDSQGNKYHAAVIVRWLLDDRDLDFLFTCFDAGLSSQELLDHLDGTNPITYEQAEMLAAFRQPAPDDEGTDA